MRVAAQVFSDSNCTAGNLVFDGGDAYEGQVKSKDYGGYVIPFHDCYKKLMYDPFPDILALYITTLVFLRSGLLNVYTRSNDITYLLHIMNSRTFIHNNTATLNINSLKGPVYSR